MKINPLQFWQRKGWMCVLVSCYLITACSKSSDPQAEMIDNSLNPISISLSDTTNTVCGEGRGQIIVNAEGGEGQLLFSLNGGSAQSDGIFPNLATGLYTVSVKDQHNCEEKVDVLLSSGISLALDVMPLIKGTCAVSSCHVAGAQAPNFELESHYFSAAQNIKRVLESNSMPPPDSGKPGLKEEEKQKIICWVRDGAPNN